jgi:hypothetical protein
VVFIIIPVTVTIPITVPVVVSVMMVMAMLILLVVIRIVMVRGGAPDKSKGKKQGHAWYYQIFHFHITAFDL